MDGVMKRVMNRVRSERGESLLEVLIAVAIMGVAVVGIMAGLTSSVLISGFHKQQATAGTAVRDYAEALQNYVADGHYAECAATYDVPFAEPAGYQKSVVAGSVQYWNGSAWQASCGTDKGLQRLTLQVRSDDNRVTEKIDLVVRKPCRLEDPLCS
ncbi:pilin/secretion family protein with methylation motif [Kribbella sp. VKM Ac-2527]|uniref:Pilin/secretion family protein with methylation motif n=1 Tax=Kribbella caucasensis TaxID=2512215 RepID=A0A4R6JHY7_9ACTN|nr:type II secretion system protein [Kribbella sp. VKM Ac-2527]TDO35713.1 pilin/secretion family protein with methylation motif [Kribbella sp. VKM Ac-2527]